MDFGERREGQTQNQAAPSSPRFVRERRKERAERNPGPRSPAEKDTDVYRFVPINTDPIDPALNFAGRERETGD